MGWFHVARAPPMDDDKIFSGAVSLSFSPLPLTLRIVLSAKRANPILDI